MPVWYGYTEALKFCYREKCLDKTGTQKPAHIHDHPAHTWMHACTYISSPSPPYQCKIVTYFIET